MSSCHLRIKKIITARLNFTDTLGSYKAFEGKSIIKYRQEISDDLAQRKTKKKRLFDQNSKCLK